MYVTRKLHDRRESPTGPPSSTVHPIVYLNDLVANGRDEASAGIRRWLDDRAAEIRNNVLQFPVRKPGQEAVNR
jgi:hypothetical protein